MNNNKELVEVLKIIDDKNKIYYTEYQLFDKDSKEKDQAWHDAMNLNMEAAKKGYKIVKINHDLGTDKKENDYSKKENDDLLHNLDDIMNQLDDIMNKTEFQKVQKR